MGAGGHAAEKATHTILPHHIRGKAMKPKYFHISHHCEKVSDIPSKAVRKVMRQAFHLLKRWGATRGRVSGCDADQHQTSPAVLPSVSYQSVRHGQR
jgi:hypothetical protein